MTTVYDQRAHGAPRSLGRTTVPSQADPSSALASSRHVRPDARRPQAAARTEAELPIQVEVLEERRADRGATRKALLRIGGRHVIETVLMGYRDRVTVCVSTQTGCAMGCGFCATGQMGLRNNLTAGEIAAQAVWAKREAAALPESTPPRRLSNVVFMGMGNHSRTSDTAGRARAAHGSDGHGRPPRHGVDRRPARHRGSPRPTRRWACGQPACGRRRVAGTSSCP